MSKRCSFVLPSSAAISFFVAHPHPNYTLVRTSKDVQELGTPFGFTIPPALIAFLIFLLIIVLWIWGLEMYKRKRETSKPSLVWIENHEYPLIATDDDSTKNIKKGDYLYHVMQIWFKNSPVIATDDAIAKDVKATVIFYNRTNKTVMPIPACFIIAEARDYGEPRESLETIDNWPPSELGKLQIAVKRNTEESAFGFAKGHDIAARALKKSSYYVKVLLEGTRVIDFKPLWFSMSNPGMNGDLCISDKPIKKPNLHKEGFPTE